MKKIKVFSGCILLILAVVIISFVQPAFAETITLNFVTDAGGMTGYNEGALKPWFEEVGKVSNGRIKIKILLGAVPNTELYDSIASGVGDISAVMTLFLPGRFPATDIVTISDMGLKCQRTGQALWDFCKQSPEIQKEFSEVKLLGMIGAPPSPPGMGFGTAKKPINKLEDIKGLKIGALGQWNMKIVEALGAVPVTVFPPQVYESLQRGIIDASFFDGSMLVDWKFMEVVKYYHLISYQFVPMPVFMNWNSWKKLPSDAQKVLEDTAVNLPKYGDDYNTPACMAALEKAKEYGVQIIDYPPEELARWQALAKPIQDEYIAELKAKGIDGRKLLDKWSSICAQYAK